MATNLFRWERKNHTLQPTVLISELYLRLFANEEAPCQNRTHFFALAASTMRHILVDHARAARAGRRGGDWSRTTMTLRACQSRSRSTIYWPSTRLSIGCAKPSPDARR